MDGLCRQCPRDCGVDRSRQLGYCRSDDQLKVAKAMLHMWEEPCISGKKGSGAIFFSGCSLRCVFCQNYAISDEGFGQSISCEALGNMMLELQSKGAHNINLVNPTHFTSQIMESLDRVKGRLCIPVVYNCGGYEKVETIRRLKDYVDIYLTDFKYHSQTLSERYSSAGDYFSVAAAAIKEMVKQTDGPAFKEDVLTRGVIIRHMVLPTCSKDSLKILDYIASFYPKEKFLLSLMSQYTPMHKAKAYPELNRRITTFEYERVLRRAEELELKGYFQERSAAGESYVPIFDLSGIPDSDRKGRKA